MTAADSRLIKRRRADLQRLSGAAVKKIVDLVPGELFRALGVGGKGLLGIFIEHIAENNKIVGFFSEENGKKSLLWASGDIGGRCLSYGTEWALQEHHDTESIPSNSYNSQAAGKSLFIVDGDVFLSFSPASELARAHTDFNLTKSVRGELPLAAVPVSKWSIWENIEAQRSRRSTPLYSYAPSVEKLH